MASSYGRMWPRGWSAAYGIGCCLRRQVLLMLKATVYYVTAECQLRCLDTQVSAMVRTMVRIGKRCSKTRVPQTSSGNWTCPPWVSFHMKPAIATLPLWSAHSRTSNGQNEGHTRVPSPRAPSLIAVNKQSGGVIWRAIGAGDRVLHGAWSSPVAANVNGSLKVLFGGGDGWLRAYDAASGHEVWRFDGNPKDARWLPRPGVLSRSSIIASPVFADGRVFVAMGQSPGHGNGPSLLHAISPYGQGDVTESGRLWTRVRSAAWWERPS